jgi:hypothetical protein
MAEQSGILRLALILSAVMMFALAVWFGYQGQVIVAAALGVAAVSDLVVMMWLLRS